MASRADFGWKLPSTIVQRLGQTTYGRQRIIFEEDHLLLILHRLPKPKEIQREATVFLRTPKGEWLCNGGSNGLFRLKGLLASYEEQYTELAKNFEKVNSPAEHFNLIERLTPVSRSSVHLYQTLQDAREKVTTDQEIIDARDRAYNIQRNFELLLIDARNGLDFRIALNAENNALVARDAVSAQHRLNILAAIFFPLMSLTAVFGMNLPSGFEKFGQGSFWFVFISGIILGLLIKNWVTENKK